MASDATLPETAAADPEAPDTAALPVVTRRARGRRRKQTSLFAMVHAELSVMLFMLGLGLWISMIVLASFFPFSVVDGMEHGGLAITVLAAITVALLAPSVFRFWTDGDRFGSVIAAGLMLAMIGNWLGWKFHFNLVVQIKQLLS